MTKNFEIENFKNESNLILEASAGTGKTYSVTEIVFKLINKYKKSLDKILIVTYTDKATGELKDRIRSKLSSNNISFNEDELNIFTIHSFCQTMIEEFGLQAKLPLKFDLINEKDEIADFFERYIREGNILNDFINLLKLNDKFKLSSLSNLLCDTALKYYLDINQKEDSCIVSLKEDNISNLIDCLINNKKNINEFKNADLLFKTNHELLELSNDDETKVLLGRIDKSIFEGVSKPAFTIRENDWPSNQEEIDALEYFQKVIKKLPSNLDLNNPIEDFLNKDNNHRNNYDVLKNSNDDKTKEMLEKINKCIRGEQKSFTFKKTQKWPKTQAEIDAIKYLLKIKEYSKITDTNLKIYYATIVKKYLKDFYIKWQDEKILNKTQAFSDMIRIVRETIKTNTCFKDEIKNKYEIAIIDEFQDTNGLQYDIFNNIFMEDNNHRIIVVGDPKQSIYLFQGADLETYKRAKEDIVNGNNKIKKGEILKLGTNWRSTESMVNSCNLFFKDDYFKESNIVFEDSNYSTKKGRIAKYYDEKLGDHKVVNAFWLVESKISENKKIKPEDFAKIAVQKIIDCCSKVEVDGKIKTKLILIENDSDGKPIERNVSFKDFAILGKTRSEFEYIRKEMISYGIPNIIYKDNKLFIEKECADWISIFEALAVPDYTGKNRAILKKALFSRFFGKSLKELSAPEYDADSFDEMEKILKWRNLAKEKKWEQLIESIIINSSILNNLGGLKNLQSITICKQIGNYAIKYLYNNHTLNDLVINLSNLSKGDESEEASFVEIGTDFDCVQLMTIHSSKGLQFPVVISVAGFKGEVNENAVISHNDKNKRIISFEKEDGKVDLKAEWLRLLYVDYTRPEYVLILPNYCITNGIYNELLIEKTDSYINRTKDLNDYILLEYDKDEIIDVDKLKETVKNVLKDDSNIPLSEKERKDYYESKSELIKSIYFKSTIKHSYSTVAHNKKALDDDYYDDLEDKEREADSSVIINDKGIQVVLNDYIEDINTIPTKFPKGKEVGSALHEVFEKSTFKDYENNNHDAKELIEKTFNSYFIKCDDESIKYVNNMLINVLNAKLPIINGSNISNDCFKLSSIEDCDKNAEMEFNFNCDNKKFKNYWNGFVDLIFRRGEYYSILDWKSDSINDTDLLSYSTNEDLKKHTDNHYSIQRVLYSYFLIKWLKQYYPNKTEEEIFNDHFGGIYYVYIRGCITDKTNGIYAQTWDSFKTLENAYVDVLKLIGGSEKWIR